MTAGHGEVDPTTQSTVKGRDSYTLVLPVQFRGLSNGRAAVESAFASHLRLLLASLSDRVESLEVMAPQMSLEDYEARQAGMAELDEASDGVRFVEAYPAGVGRMKFLFWLPLLALRLWRCVGRSDTIHSGMSPELWKPFENLALLFGWMRRRRTLYFVDIDHRRSPRMQLQTGAWSIGVYLRAQYFHGRWASLQTFLAVRMCSAVFLKGHALVRDYGRGRASVHYILDAAHSADMVIGESDLSARICHIDTQRDRLRVCYFGRLAKYKGIDHMLRAIAVARAGGVPVTFDVYGGGDAAESLEELSRELDLADVVTWWGVRPYGADFFAELALYDLLLAAPLSEDTPRSAVDAQALGMPVLAYDTYYYKDLAEDGAGITVVPWLDYDAMAMEIGALHVDRPRLGALSQRAVRFARANTQEIWLERRARQSFSAS